jgi:hypothetical protein
MSDFLKIFLSALAVFALAWFIWAFVRGVKRVKLAKAQCGASMRKWLLEKADDCDLKAEEDDSTKTPPVIEEGK